MDKGLQINFSDHQKYVLECKDQEIGIYRRLIVDFTQQMFQHDRKSCILRTKESYSAPNVTCFALKL